MACFIVPGTEAIVTTAITKIVEKKEKKEICSCETEGAVEAVKEEKVLPFSRKLRWLNSFTCIRACMAWRSYSFLSILNSSRQCSRCCADA